MRPGVFRKELLVMSKKTTTTTFNNNVEGWNHNTELSVNLKTMLRTDRTMQTGRDYLASTVADSSPLPAVTTARCDSTSSRCA